MLRNILGAGIGAAVLCAAPILADRALADNNGLIGRDIDHVLLISVDGLHAVDLSTYVSTHPVSTLAALSTHGITFTNNFSSGPSDSFPGLAALVTGGSPVTTGFWYDDTFNRVLSPPRQTDGLGNPGGACPGTIGTRVALDEAIDIDLTQLNGGGGLNPNFLVRDPQADCTPILPHQYLRVNTIFEVVRGAGRVTAWTDKHPSYEWLNGPSGLGVEDFFGPEINSIPVGLPQFAGCSPIPFSDPTPDDGWTTSFANIQCYDDIHVQAVLNQIDGFSHDRSRKIGVPALFGTNFQSVSVGEKLAKDPVTGVKGGYLDAIGTPGPALAAEMDFVDHSLGMMVAELKAQGLFNSTLIIVAAKHGQSPIDVTKRVGIGGGEPTTTLGAADAFDISDDGSLIWLTSSSLTASTVALLSEPATQQALGIQEIFSGTLLKDKFNDPTIDPRTPDIILKTNTGVIFTGGKKLAEHGGFNEDDAHTALLVSLNGVQPSTLSIATTNQQVAPTIVKALGLDPNLLEAVRREQIKVLPFLFEPQPQTPISPF
jgi:Type I phosphodiesterase / nucleotide pyrophosphatase